MLWWSLIILGPVMCALQPYNSVLIFIVFLVSLFWSFSDNTVSKEKRCLWRGVSIGRMTCIICRQRWGIGLYSFIYCNQNPMLEQGPCAHWMLKVSISLSNMPNSYLPLNKINEGGVVRWRELWRAEERERAGLWNVDVIERQHWVPESINQSGRYAWMIRNMWVFLNLNFVTQRQA